VIRLAGEDDWPSILEVHRAAFGDDDVPRLAAELHARQDLYVPELSFVAEDEAVVVGHVMNTWSWIEETEERILQLSPLGVLPAHQRRGHGSELVQASLDAVRAAGEPLLLVQGEPAYYGRFGFVRASELGLLRPPEALNDYGFQVAVLDPQVTLPQGQVVYSEPFRH
jgi:putative acetyltransferase